MLTLVPFSAEHAQTVVSWVDSPTVFARWSSGVLSVYPATPQSLIQYYENPMRRDVCVPLLAQDERGICGHIMLRYLGDLQHTVRFGLVLVDSARRGEGIGRRMLQLAIAYAVNRMHACRIIISVFEDNIPALSCYTAAGFVPYRSYKRRIGRQWQSCRSLIWRGKYRHAKRI